MLYTNAMRSQGKTHSIKYFWIPLFGICILLVGKAVAQNSKQVDFQNDAEYMETQKFLAKTNNLITRTKLETDARAKEIEALTNRVGELIANMGSTSEDAYNLRSELSVQIDLLKIERETTEGLRRQMLRINKRLETEKQSKSEAKGKLQTLIVALRAENKKVRESLRALENQNKNNSNTEIKLRSELEAQRAKHIKSIERLESKFESMISSLRKENATAKKRIMLLERKQKNKVSVENKLQANLKSLRAEHAKALRRLNQELEKVTNQTDTNRTMKSKVDKLQQELLLLKQNKSLPLVKSEQ